MALEALRFLSRETALGIVRRGLLDSVRILWSGRDDWKLDFRYGTKTGGLVKAADVKGPNANLATAYRGVRAIPLKKFLALLALDRKMGFVDVGSGKGRAMMLAADYGFERVTGVEFSASLVQIACQNIERIRSRFPKTEFEVLHEDAAEFVPRSTDQVFFFYDPFSAAVMSQCLRRIKESYHWFPRPLYVILHNNLVNHLESEFPELRMMEDNGRHSVDGNQFYVRSLG